MSTPKNVSEQWADLCEEFSAEQARTLGAMRFAESNGVITADGAERINEAAEAEAEVKKRMDEFIKLHG